MFSNRAHSESLGLPNNSSCPRLPTAIRNSPRPCLIRFCTSCVPDGFELLSYADQSTRRGAGKLKSSKCSRGRFPGFSVRTMSHGSFGSAKSELRKSMLGSGKHHGGISAGGGTTGLLLFVEGLVCLSEKLPEGRAEFRGITGHTHAQRERVLSVVGREFRHVVLQ